MSRVSIFGLGYVGAVTSACLAGDGHDVVGVDVNPTKVEMIEAGQSPVIEDGLAQVVADARASGRMRATTSVVDAIRDTDVSLICVGTPSNTNGSLDLGYVRRVATEIGQALRRKETHHVVVVRSTMLPGSTEDVVIPALQAASGRSVGDGFSVAYNPEFLREGTSVADFRRPPHTVVGGTDERAIEAVRELYSLVEAPFTVVAIRVAEMVKYASNAFHALKVSFANEIGAICKAQGIDSHEVMAVFANDRKLNISPAYLRPGYAFGGSCLPKDLRALLYQSHMLDLYPAVLEAILPSNQRQVDAAYQLVSRSGSKRVGILGFSFKEGTDDLRESPLVDLIERLIGKGYTVTLYDRNVSLASLHGANRAYIEREIPHIASIMTESMDAVLDRADVIIIGNGDPEFASVSERLGPEQRIIDLVRMVTDPSAMDGRYEGIAW